MKVVFLDIDGVLIHYKSIPRFGARKPDPECVKRLNQITDATGAKIIVSSTWRRDDKIDRTLKDWGITGEVYGRTPSGYDPNRISLGSSRGAEINAWLRETEFQIDRFVILDDDTDMDPLRGALIQTSMIGGLKADHVERAIQRLGVPG